MKKWIAFILLLVSLHASAQRKLKYDIIKETGDTLFNSGDERLYIKAGDTRGYGSNKITTVGDYIKSTVYRSSNGYMIGFEMQTGRTNSFSIYNGQSAEFILADGSVVKLESRGNYSSKKSAMGYGCFLFCYYGLNASSIAKLKAQGIQSIRINSSMGFFDYELKAKFADTIREQLQAL